MSRPHGVDAAGNPLDLIGRRLDTRPASSVGVTIIRKDTTDMAKAEKNGVYTLNGHRFRIKAGDVLPEGAVMDGEAEVRKQDAAPENKSKQAAPENRAKKAD